MFLMTNKRVIYGSVMLLGISSAGMLRPQWHRKCFWRTDYIQSSRSEKTKSVAVSEVAVCLAEILA